MKYVKIFIGILYFMPFLVSAADPSVSSFNIGSSSINSAQIASFSWRTADSGGYSFLVSCVQGFKFKKTDGSLFPCDTPMSSTQTAVDGIDLNVWNLSGTTRSFTARLTPKDASGADFPATRQDVQVSVTTALHPIDSVTGTTTIKSSEDYVLSWTGSLIDGVNLSISCAPTIRTTSTSYTSGTLPCGTHIFSSNLPATGSLHLVFENSDINVRDITLTLTPLVDTSFYNGMNTESVTVSVESNIIPNPQTSLFSASSTSDYIASDSLLPFSWITTNATGANVRLSCNEYITTKITVGNASTTPSCAVPSFDTPLTTTGTGTFLFSNKSGASQSITITLMPMLSNGNYDATRAKSLSFNILPKGGTVPVLATTTPATSTPKSTTSQKTASKVVFTKYLQRGSTGPEVSALQELLKKDSSIYPEGAVVGVFGPATERAVRRLQLKHKLASTSTPGFGTVGPKTRALLNSLAQN